MRFYLILDCKGSEKRLILIFYFLNPSHFTLTFLKR